MNKAKFQVIKVRTSFTTSLCCIAAALVLILSACSTSSNQTTATTPSASTGSPSSQQPGAFGLAALTRVYHFIICSPTIRHYPAPTHLS